MELKVIAYFKSPFSSKFGIPRQSGLVEQVEGAIVFVPEWQRAEAIRGLEEYDYLWLLWGFSANKHEAVGTTVRPPRLGGNERMGVFATRSPYRPNPIGLSSVRIKKIEVDPVNGPVIRVIGADLMDGTPIYDIKPYLEYTDSHTQIRSGMTDTTSWKNLEVVIPDDLVEVLGEECEALREILALDPRPHYHTDNVQKGRIYGMPFKDRDIRFTVEGNRLTVVEVK